MSRLRLCAPSLLILHILLRSTSISEGVLNELILYNLIPIASIISLSFAPNICDSLSKPFTAIGITMWSIGSCLASANLFFPTQTHMISNIMYLLFYPFILIGLPRLVATARSLKVLEIVDSSIFGLGLSTLGTAFVLKPVLPHFSGDVAETYFAILYPVADLILISLIIAAVFSQGLSIRGTLLSLGVLVFTTTDFIYLWMQINGAYFIGATIEIGWLLAFVIISESYWHTGKDAKSREGIHPILISISVFLSATLLALIAIRPGYFPRFILFPAIATLALAFTRMAIALSQARSIGAERLLARTDELTGLPNRRRLISEIENFVSKDGALMLLDLDGFKPVNDTHGHETGDKVLQQVALRFERALPHGALLARLGGDEFGVLYEGALDSAVEVALALRATLSYPFHIDNKEIQLGVSIGVAKNHGERDLLVRADNAMYTAKREGLGVYRL